MTPEAIARVLAEEIRRVAPEADLAALPEDADIRDQLDIDSMDFLTLVTALCARLGIAIPERDYGELRSLAAAKAYLAGKGAGQGAPR